MLEEQGMPRFFAYCVCVGELLATILLIVGYRTCFMANYVLVTLLAYGNEIVALGKIGGWAVELFGLYFWGALTLFFAGGGRYALSNCHYWD